MKEKAELIQDILGLRQRAGRVLGRYVLEHWQPLNLSSAQVKTLLLILARETTNCRTLARELNVTPGNITGIVDRMVEQGLVVRSPDITDRRVTWLSASDKGRELFTSILETETRDGLQVLNKMNRKDLAAFSRGLQAYLDAVEKFQNG